jgi:hypothetical protein
MQGIESDPINKLCRPLDVPDSKVARLAALERAAFGKPAERARRLPCDSCYRLVNSHPEKRRRHIHDREQ